MKELIRRYTHWLHTQWPAGEVERLPRVNEDFSTNVPGVYIVGDLTGIPLLKYAVDSGSRAVRHIAESPGFRRAASAAQNGVVDIAILGAGVSGMSAALEAGRLGLTYVIIEGNESFATIRDFPSGKPIYTYPTDMTPAGSMSVRADVKEALVEELLAQTEQIPVRRGKADRIERGKDGLAVVLEDGTRVRSRSVLVAIGKTGKHRRLGVPGENRPNVYHRLHDPAAFTGQKVLVVGGGDSALEATILLVEARADVTLSYRGREFSRPKREHIEKIQQLAARTNGTESLDLVMESQVTEIGDGHVTLAADGESTELPNDVVFLMIGRDAPLEFFRKSGIAIRNDWGEWPKLNWRRIAALASFLLFAAALYNWKDGGFLHDLAEQANAFPFSIRTYISEAAINTASLPGVILTSAHAPAFWYTLAYSLLIIVFGFLRIKRRRTPYVKVQTATLMAIQVLPLFILPEIVLPYLANNGMMPESLLNGLFPQSEWATHGREYWRAYGFILAWPLLAYNVFTQEPLFWWLAISFAQTFVLIPAMIYYWGKGAYCGWICSCGALAETLGDNQRDKMPHGGGWNKFNMAGQVILLIAFVILIWRIIGWVFPGSWFEGMFNQAVYGQVFGLELNYYWTVDVIMAGVIGYGVYFWLSGRFWCRFLCPLAALMNVFNRFSRFRILAEKEKCISCNVCTTVCHQGIDVMSFAQRGLPMADPQCVRCSACVHSCPTGVLSFGQIDTRTGAVISRDSLEASLARVIEAERVRRPLHPVIRHS